MAKMIIRVVGIAFFLIGLVLLVLPIPFGVFFTLLGLLLLIPTSPLVSSSIRRLRRRSAKIDSLFIKASERVPSPYRRILRSTDPDHWG